MNNVSTKAPSKTDWNRIGKQKPEEIDTSDIPPLDPQWMGPPVIRPAFKGEAKIVAEENKHAWIEPEITAWFEAQGGDVAAHMNQALREYVSARTETEKAA